MVRKPTSTRKSAGRPKRGGLPTPATPELATRHSELATHRRPSAVLDTRVIYCGDCLDQLRKLPDACIDLIYIDPPFNSNRNYEVFWGETKEKRAFETHLGARTCATSGSGFHLASSLNLLRFAANEPINCRAQVSRPIVIRLERNGLELQQER